MIKYIFLFNLGEIKKCISNQKPTSDPKLVPPT